MLSSSPKPQNSGSLLEEYLNHSQVQYNPAPGQLQQDTHTAHHTHTHTHTPCSQRYEQVLDLTGNKRNGN